MNDSMSILLASTILALGGLGLYMYKSVNEDNKTDDEEYNEDSLFGGSFWGLGDKDDKDEDIEAPTDEHIEEIFKPRRKNVKTQRNRKPSGNSRRRY
jgi:hypothetical protein